MKERRPPAEGEPDGPVSVYWLAFKSQLIRCAPHHVRADVKSFDHAIDDTQKALNTVRQLRSRGVTRFYDLQRTNRQNLADVEEDEHGEGSTLDTESEHEMAPPRQRPRLTMDPPIPAAADVQAPAEPQALEAPQQRTAPTALDQGPVAEAFQEPPAVPDDEDGLPLPSQEPREEPPAATTTPHRGTTTRAGSCNRSTI